MKENKQQQQRKNTRRTREKKDNTTMKGREIYDITKILRSEKCAVILDEKNTNISNYHLIPNLNPDTIFDYKLIMLH